MDNLFRKVFNNLVIRNKIYYYLKIIYKYHKTIVYPLFYKRDINSILSYKGIEFFKELFIHQPDVTIKKDTFPSYITFDVLDMTNSFNSIIENGSLPDSVTDLRLPTNFNDKLLNGIYPKNLKKLCLTYRNWGEKTIFGTMSSKYKMKSDILAPQTLEYLKIKYYCIPFNNYLFKISSYSTSIHTLELYNYNDDTIEGTLKANMFPQSLTKLVLNCRFKNIERNVFSKTKIKELIFLEEFNHSLVLNKSHLPPTLETLQISGKYDHLEDDLCKIFEPNSLPNGLKKFIVYTLLGGFNQKIEINNFFPISCRFIKLQNFKRSITTTLNEQVVPIFPNNLVQLEFIGEMLDQPLFLLPNSIIILKIYCYECTRIHNKRFHFNQPLIHVNCLPMNLKILVLDYKYYLNIINGVINKIKWLPNSIISISFIYITYIRNKKYLGKINDYINQFQKDKKNCPFDNLEIISNLKYLQVSNIYYQS